MLEEEKHLAEQGLNEQAQRTEALEARMAALEEALKGQAQELASLKEAIKNAPQPAPRAEKPQDRYQAAYELFRQENYPQAREAFEAFLKAYPQHPLAGNAQFWLAETFYKEANYEEAILGYEEVLKKYPRSPKVPAALLKQALAFLKMQDQKVAEAILKELIQKYPESTEAVAARQRLKLLRQKEGSR
jgi:tol-pal system protein YbgF